MTPYPLIYTPKGTAKPACCAHAGPMGALEGHGPDWDPVAKTGGGGLTWGGPYVDGSAGWVRSPAGWWVRLHGHRPQDVLRLAPHPRVIERRWIDGAHPGQRWSIPTLVRCVGERSFAPVIDGIWDGKAWTQGDLGPIVESLMCFANEVPLAVSIEERNRAFMDLAVSIMAIDHWVDEALLAATGWLSERLMVNVVLAAGDGLPRQAASP